MWEQLLLPIGLGKIRKKGTNVEVEIKELKLRLQLNSDGRI